MLLLDSLLSVESLQGALAVIVIWVLGKALDRLFGYLLNKRIFSVAYSALRWRVKAILTYADPIEASFEVSFTPDQRYGEYPVSEMREKLESIFSTIESESKGRIDVNNVMWDGKTATSTITHTEASYGYQTTIDLVRDQNDLIENPEQPVRSQLIEKVAFSIDFKFSFRNIEKELTNLGTFGAFLEDSLKDQFKGQVSTGRFIISPLENDLTVDEWIRNEEFDMSVMLTDRNSKVERTKVEFFPDRALVHPPYLKMDSETVHHIKLLVLNYYLR